MMSEKILKLRIAIVFFAMVVTVRVFYLTVLCNEELRSKAEAQNTVNLSISVKRNDFLDRRNRYITGLERKRYIAVFSSNDNKTDEENCKLVAQFTDENEKEILNRLKNQKKIFVRTNVDVDENRIKNIRYIKSFYSPTRYLKDYPAAAVIGYTADGQGASGLEKVYNDVLVSKDNSATVETDARQNVIGEISVAGNDVNEKKIKTTIDLDYQRICQDTLDEYDIKGGAVLLDVKSFDVLAMASAPTFEQDNIGKYLNDSDGALQNRCLMAYDMGSIFKIIVSAAALEKGNEVLQRKYNCNGTKYISGKAFDCHYLYGHGVQNLTDAFKNSCNCAFIEIGIDTGYGQILNMAKKFNIGKKNLYPLSMEQQSGVMPDENNYYIADLANLSIGQGKLSGTVLDGAIISAVIAGGGVIKNANIVDSITDSYGQTVRKLKCENNIRIISRETADMIYNMMLETNKSGTGTTGQINEAGSGGKTGSAQTGWYVKGENYQHGWFTGFFPAEHPKYALCVFVENGKSGSVAAAPIFKEIGEKIMDLN